MSVLAEPRAVASGCYKQLTQDQTVVRRPPVASARYRSRFCNARLTKTKKPAALSPSLAGSQRIGGREAADPIASNKLQFVDDAESTKSGSLSARRFFISSRRSFNRRNFKRLNFARVAFAARNCNFKFVNVPISALLNSAAAAKVQLQWRGREVVWQRLCHQRSSAYLRPNPCY